MTAADRKRNADILNSALKESVRNQVRSEGFAYLHPCYKHSLATVLPDGCKVATVHDDGFIRIEAAAQGAIPRK